MANYRQIKQFCYPDDGTVNNWINGNIFSDYFPIYQLGIQGPPGTEFYLNGSIKPMKIGFSGIYDLDIRNDVTISKIEFNSKSLERLDNNQKIIVDIIYGKEE